MEPNTSVYFSQSLLGWFAQYGRHDLPWQQARNAYRVWVSEIMLQQTQVSTVIPYFERFMQGFPSVQVLAEAHIDDVLQYWSGLGYYARARNLHKAAIILTTEYKGELPQDIDALQALPGIGRSTAGAIMAQAFNQRYAILDGNVKRVLSRYFAVQGWSGHSNVTEQLWQYAETLTPHKQLADYTQAIMDLGATVCRRSKPQCSLCPVVAGCQAYNTQRIAEFPSKKPRKALPVKTTQMLLLRDNSSGTILLERRPPTGIWGGMLSLPELAENADPAEWCQQQLPYRQSIQIEARWASFRHTFSHYHLNIYPVLASLSDKTSTVVLDTDRWVWYNGATTAGGVPAPIKQLLQKLQQSTLFKEGIA